MHDLLPVASVFAAATVVVIEHGTQPVIERNVFSEGQRAANACTSSAGTTITVTISFDGSAGTDGCCHFSTVYAQSTVYGCATGSSFIITAVSINSSVNGFTCVTSVAARGCQRSAAHGHRAADSCGTVAKGVVVTMRTATAAIAARGRQCSACQGHRAVDGYATGTCSIITGTPTGIAAIAAFGCQRSAGQDERAVAFHGRGGAVVRAVDVHRAIALYGERCAVT